MYRRSKSLEVILAIRTAMSEEAGHDIPTFVEMVRTGVAPVDNARTVTRVEGKLRDELLPERIAERSKAAISDE